MTLRSISTSVPIVVAFGGDLVQLGLVATLARPGGNVTGQQILSPELGPKRLQLIREIIPRLDRLALLHPKPSENPQSVSYYDRIATDLESAARPLSIRILRFTVDGSADFDRAFSEMKSAGVQAILVFTTPFFRVHLRRIVDLATSHRLPSIHEFAESADAGALASYGVNFADTYRGAVRYVDRILKGAKPAELPIQQPTKFELVINLKTAKTLGLTVPPSVLARADRVIQ